MITRLNTRVLLSLAAIGVASALIIGATIAFFSDTETSSSNQLQAGALDLKIDSEAHYAGMICLDAHIDPNIVQLGWSEDSIGSSNNTRPELLTKPCEGTWELKDLEEGDQFFDLTDIKPGDEGENTISLHVFDNDAWGRIRITDISDDDETCTEPENETVDGNNVDADLECPWPTPAASPDPGNGEVAENINFFIWLDEGSDPGFQCYDPVSKVRIDPCADSGEGDNIFDSQNEEPTRAENVIETNVYGDIQINLAPALAEAYLLECEGKNADGHNDYGTCHGLAADGRLVGSATYYIGVAWCLGEVTEDGCDGSGVGNEVQTDSINADIHFDITQHRNQPNPWGPVI